MELLVILFILIAGGAAVLWGFCLPLRARKWARENGYRYVGSTTPSGGLVGIVGSGQNSFFFWIDEDPFFFVVENQDGLQCTAVMDMGEVYWQDEGTMISLNISERGWHKPNEP